MGNKRLTYAQRQILADVTPDDLYYWHLDNWFEDAGVPYPNPMPNKYLRIPAFKELSKELQDKLHRKYVNERTMPRHVYKYFWKGNEDGYCTFRYEDGFLIDGWCGNRCRISKKILKEWNEEAFSRYENMPASYRMYYEQVLYEDLDEKKRQEIKSDLTRGGRPLSLYSRGCPPDRLRYQPFDAYMVKPLKVGCLIPRELCETWENEQKEYRAKMRAWHHENAIARAKKKQTS